jgi:predicted Fe-Mo cluster-binding NifX family protein
MKLAIPEFNGRVSPVFDCSRRLLVIDTAVQGQGRITIQDWTGVDGVKRTERLLELGVNTLLCGGISSDLAGQIKASGIKVISWISGEVSEVLAAYQNGALPDPELTMPGCRRTRFRGQACSRQDLTPEKRGSRRKATEPGWR